jgi:hypothetical protein
VLLLDNSAWVRLMRSTADILAEHTSLVFDSEWLATPGTL